MKKCPKCKTVYLDDEKTCRKCGVLLIEPETEEKKKSTSVLPVLIYTFIFILFIMAMYFVVYLLRGK